MPKRIQSICQVYPTRTADQVEIRVKALLARLLWRSAGILFHYESERPGSKKSNGVVGIQQPHALRRFKTLKNLIIRQIFSFNFIRQYQANSTANGNQGKIDRCICSVIGFIGYLVTYII